MANAVRFDAIGLLTLREIRRFVRNSSARGGVVFFGLLYVLGSLFLGGMIALGNVEGGYSLFVLWNGSAGAWNYPGLLLIAPWGVVSLPFFATFAMIVVGVGVGFGMTVAFLLVVRLLRPQHRGSGGTTTASTVAGLTPAMISLVTLGACCSTTAAAIAGVGLVAQASGTSAATLLLNNWYLGVFQIVMVWVALLAQEMLLVVYGGLFGAPAPEAPAVAPRLTRRLVLSGAVRAVLLGSGIVWALSIVAQWTVMNPATAGPGWWVQWLGQHGLLSAIAIGVALFPVGTLEVLERSRRVFGGAFPVIVALFGLSVLTWVPPPLPAWGLDGLVNQVLGVLGVSGWGAIAPGALGGPALVARWLGEYVLLGSFAVIASIWPRRLGALLLGTALPHADRSGQESPAMGTDSAARVTGAPVGGGSE